MKIHKALKVKNRLAGEVARLQGILVRENARRNDNVSLVDRQQVFNDLTHARENLIKIKGAIALATAPVVEKLACLDELKSYVNFLNQLYTREGEEVAFVGRDQEKLVYQWNSFLNKEAIDKTTKDVQDLINGLQDEVDDFNAKTDVVVDF